MKSEITKSQQQNTADAIQKICQIIEILSVEEPPIDPEELEKQHQRAVEASKKRVEEKRRNSQNRRNRSNIVRDYY